MGPTGPSNLLRRLGAVRLGPFGPEPHRIAFAFCGPKGHGGDPILRIGGASGPLFLRKSPGYGAKPHVGGPSARLGRLRRPMRALIFLGYGRAFGPTGLRPVVKASP